MKILVTGARGFVGRNLVSQLRNIQSGKVKCYGDLTVDAVYEYDIDSTIEELDSCGSYTSTCTMPTAGIPRRRM